MPTRRAAGENGFPCNRWWPARVDAQRQTNLAASPGWENDPNRRLNDSCWRRRRRHPISQPESPLSVLLPSNCRRNSPPPLPSRCLIPVHFGVGNGHTVAIRAGGRAREKLKWSDVADRRLEINTKERQYKSSDDASGAAEPGPGEREREV